VLLEEGFALVVAELAVVLAGGCIVPLDPTQPSARITALLTDCQAVLLLASTQQVCGCACDGAELLFARSFRHGSVDTGRGLGERVFCC
jgi:acyl-CoA synthetase (AMP-forming)/AMP-acid ligase II